MPLFSAAALGTRGPRSSPCNHRPDLGVFDFQDRSGWNSHGGMAMHNCVCDLKNYI